MTTMEKIIILLREMREQSLESLYDFICSIWVRQNVRAKQVAKRDDIFKSMEGFAVLQSFAGTLPADFDYKKELEEMREEKYDNDKYRTECSCGSQNVYNG